MNTENREDEIKFKDLLKNPLRLYGWIFPLFAVLILGLGIFFVKNLNQISFNEQPVSVPDTINVNKEIVLKKGGIMPAVDLAIVRSPSAEFISKGKELFNANCKSCHGDKGMGDGTAGAMLNPKPRNFHTADGWTNGRAIEQMYKTLQEGIIKNGMAAYEYLSPSDRFAIISYIRTFVQFPEIKDDVLKALDQTYQLSKGTVVPNQIPVATAILKLDEENALLNQKIEIVKHLLLVTKDNPAASLLQRSALNLEKVFVTYSSSNVNSSLDSFINSVAANPISYGFKPSVIQLSRDDFSQLYNYLKTVMM